VAYIIRGIRADDTACKRIHQTHHPHNPTHTHAPTQHSPYLAVKDLEPLMELVADRVKLRDVVSDRLGVRERVWALRVRDGVFECVGVGEWVADWEGGAPGSAGGGHAIHDGWFRLFTSRPRPWPRYPNGVRASRSPGNRGHVRHEWGGGEGLRSCDQTIGRCDACRKDMRAR
jgi:hypothetical protein